jgi:hypothetical protein
MNRYIQSFLLAMAGILLLAVGGPPLAAGSEACKPLPGLTVRLDRAAVLRFFETTEVLERAARELGLKPFVSPGNASGRADPIDIAQSLGRHAEGREMLGRRLRQSGFCGTIDFAKMQRNIYQAQNFIDLGEDEAALQRQLDANCTRVCSSALMRLGDEPIPDCHEKCKVSDADFYAPPPAENVAVLKALQGEIPTAYILSW